MSFPSRHTGFDLATLLSDHASVFWNATAQALVAPPTIKVVPRAAILDAASGVVVAGDLAFDPSCRIVHAECFGRPMPIFAPLDPSEFPGCLPVPGHDWLWRTPAGALMPAFDMVGAIAHLLGFGDEANTAARDRHGRLPPEASLLGRAGLLHVPVVNVWLFALLAAAKGAAAHGAPLDPSAHVLAPVLLLSHDCDQLSGNDLYTQLSRASRFAAPLRRLRAPAWRQLAHIAVNARHPRRYFFDDARAMLSSERAHGVRSAFYFLTGARGRYGARSSDALIREFAALIPEDCEIGIHYNYRTSRDAAALAAQKSAIEGATGRRVRSGRAHYLALNPPADFAVLAATGIENDETLGFAGANGFRLGYAGAYRVAGASESELVEIPLQFMDTNMTPTALANEVFPMAQAVERVGGAVTVLFHPGSYDNPESPELRDVYDMCLKYFVDRGYRSYLPGEVGDQLRQVSARHRAAS